MSTTVSVPSARADAAPGLGAPTAGRPVPAVRGGRRRRLLLRLVSLLVLYVLWELAARLVRNPTFIPSPAAVWHQLIVTSSVHDGVRGYSGHLPSPGRWRCRTRCCCSTSRSRHWTR